MDEEYTGDNSLLNRTKRVFKVAIIGCGGISTMHLQGLEASDKCELVCICDIDEELVVAKAQEYGVDYATDIDVVLKREDIDSVHILTPHYLHADMAEKAINAGKQVILEKPVEISKEEVMKLKELSEKCDVQIGEVFQNRYNNTSKKLKK